MLSDPVWHNFLQIPESSTGTVNASAEHIQMLQSLIIEKNSSQAVDFVSEPWNDSDAALVTPGPAVCIQWNNAALRKIYRETEQSIFVCTAEDTIKGRSIGMREKYTLQAHQGRKKQTEGATHQRIFPIKSKFLSA